MADQNSPVSFETHDPSFATILGPSPSVALLASDPNGAPMYHEACIYDAESHSIFITSNQIPTSALSHSLHPLPAALVASGKTVRLTRVYDNDTDPSAIRTEDITPPNLPFANGGVNYKSGILICAQGNPTHTGADGIVFASTPPPLSPGAISSQPSFSTKALGRSVPPGRQAK